MKISRIRAAFLVASLLFTTMPADAASLNGTWSGNGYVQPREGRKEAVRCRVTYDQQSATVYGVRATCASQSNSLRQTGEVLQIRPDRYAGDFYNRQFDVGGRITVSVRGSRQTVTFSGNGIAGQLTLSRR